MRDWLFLLAPPALIFYFIAYPETNSMNLFFGKKRWSRLSEQIFRIDKWSFCQG